MKLNESEEFYESLIEYRETIFNEIMNDSFYENRFINGLLYAYAYDGGYGEHPGYTFDLKKAEENYIKFKAWAEDKIRDLIQSVDVIYDEYYEEFEEEYGEDAEQMAFVDTIDYIQNNWSDDESIKWAFKQENIHMNKDIDELRDHVKEFDDWEEWDSDFDLYLETMPQRLIEEKVFE